MARRNAREKARRAAEQAAMTDRFRSIMAARALIARAEVDRAARARMRVGGRAARDVRVTLDELFATMRIVTLPDAYVAHAIRHKIVDPLTAQAEVDEFHEGVFSAWSEEPGHSLWHTVTAYGLANADSMTASSPKPEIAACVPGPGKPTAGWRLMTRAEDPVWIACKNRHASWANGNGKALQKAINDAVAAGLLPAPAGPVPQLTAIT